MAEGVVPSHVNAGTMVQVIPSPDLPQNHDGQEHPEQASAEEQQQRQQQQQILTLRLRPRPSVTWGQDVINNEGMGKKSSKRCCIFHKQRKVGESDSDESDSEADDEERERRWAHPKPGKPKAHELYHA